MKKKIIYGLLLAVAVVTASSSFVSCKDYEGDDLARLKNDLAIAQITNQASIDELIRLQLATVQDQLNSLAATLATVGTAGQNDAYAEYQDELNALLAAANDPNNTLEEKLAILAQLNELIAKINGIGNATGVAMPNAVDVILAYWGDSLRAAYDTAFLAWFKANEAYELAAQADDKANANAVQIEQNRLAIEAARTYAYTLFEQAQQLADAANAALKAEIINTLYTELAERDAKIAGLDTKIDGVKDELTQKLAALEAAYKAADQALEDKINAVDQKLDDKVAAINNQIAALDQTIKDLEKDLNDKLAQLEADYKAADQALEVKIQAVEDGYKAADQLLQDQIDNLEKRVAANEKNIENILGVLKKQITGVIIQATYSPVLGNGSLPLGIQTNLLAAYAGKNDTGADVKFPTFYGFVSNNEPITEEDYDYLVSLGQWPEEVTLASSKYIIGDSAANAGKLYLTVNPTNIDFEGTDFTLVNSQGKIAKVELSPLKASEETLTFGWTRAAIEAASQNGFYEVNAKINADDIEDMQAAISKDKLKAAAKELIGGSRRLAVKDLARAVYNSLEPLQRFGVQATWFDETIGENRSYTSAYDIAATVVNPLGFGFEIPSISALKKLQFNKQLVADSLHFDINVPLLIITAQDKATGKYIIPVEIPEIYLNPDVIEIVNGQEFYYGHAIYKPEDAAAIWQIEGYEFRSGYAYIDFTNIFEELFGEFNTAFKSFSNLGAQINGQIDNVVDQLNSYIDRYNYYYNKVNSAINNFGNALQPVLIWSDGENAGQLEGFVSANHVIATTVPAGGSLALYPTSYTLELLAPAYKKSLIVTNVYKNDETSGKLISAQGVHGELEDALKAVNDDLKAKGFTLYEGQGLKNPYIFDATGYEGLTFEFTYTAVDYSAEVAGRKFYLTVGK